MATVNGEADEWSLDLPLAILVKLNKKNVSGAHWSSNAFIAGAGGLGAFRFVLTTRLDLLLEDIYHLSIIGIFLN